MSNSLDLDQGSKIIAFFSLLTLMFHGFCCCLLAFFKLTFFKMIFQEHYQSVKQFGSRSVPTICPS